VLGAAFDFLEAFLVVQTLAVGPTLRLLARAMAWS
jgi:hypothetical protein